MEGKCIFSDDKCWWKHKDNQDKAQITIECFICKNIFTSKDLIMMHRKDDHSSLVKICNKYENNECSFGDDECWYKHRNEDTQKESIEMGEKKEESTSWD